MSTPGAFLVVEDEPPLRRSLVAFFSKYRECHAAGTLEQAREILGTHPPLNGLVVDIGLPDGNGFDLVEAVRRRDWDIRILMLTGLVDASVSNHAYRLGAECIEKPCERDNLVRFVRRCVLVKHASPDKLRQTLEQLAELHALTPRETEVLALALGNLQQKEMAEELGISRLTLKSHVDSLREKFRAESLQQLALDVACAALGSGPLRLR